MQGVVHRTHTLFLQTYLNDQILFGFEEIEDDSYQKSENRKHETSLKCNSTDFLG